MAIAIKRLNAFILKAKANDDPSGDILVISAPRVPAAKNLRKILNDLEHEIKVRRMYIETTKKHARDAKAEKRDVSPAVYDRAKAQIAKWKTEIADLETKLKARKAQAKDAGVGRRIV